MRGEEEGREGRGGGNEKTGGVKVERRREG